MRKIIVILGLLTLVSVPFIGASCFRFNKEGEQTSSTQGKSDVITENDKKKIDQWITDNSLNEYGDSKDTVYTGGTPLFDEKTGKMKDRYEYIVEKHPDLKEELKLDYKGK